MSIEEAKTKKTELEKNILHLLRQFEIETNCQVSSISILVGGENDHLCKVETHIKI